MVKDKVMSISDAIALIDEGDHVGFGGVITNRKPMAMIFELIKQQKKDLVVSILTGNFGIDAMIGMGQIKTLNTIYCGLENLGFAPNFQQQVQAGALPVNEFTEMQFFMAVRASEMGLPFLPTRTGFGSELIRVNPYLTMMKCPHTEEELVAVKAIEPDVTIIHSMVGDHQGNIQLEGSKTYMDDSISRSCKIGGKVIVSVEKLVDTEYIYRNPINTIINSFEVDVVVEVPFGSHPGSFAPLYASDMATLMTLANALAKPKRLNRWLEKNIFSLNNWEEYLQKFKLKKDKWWEEKK
ncbi:MAG: CoA transferase subunit A [Candidatus Helarchaeota archaeon]|nr:CoA transferase subunit A [Candidatus Helarchaeota archaeon]